MYLRQAIEVVGGSKYINMSSSRASVFFPIVPLPPQPHAPTMSDDYMSEDSDGFDYGSDVYDDDMASEAGMKLL